MHVHEQMEGFAQLLLLGGMNFVENVLQVGLTLFQAFHHLFVFLLCFVVESIVLLLEGVFGLTETDADHFVNFRCLLFERLHQRLAVLVRLLHYFGKRFKILVRHGIRAQMIVYGRAQLFSSIAVELANLELLLWYGNGIELTKESANPVADNSHPRIGRLGEFVGDAESAADGGGARLTNGVEEAAAKRTTARSHRRLGIERIHRSGLGGGGRSVQQIR